MDYEDNKMSRFNAGVALAERIDSLQRAINSARFNPLRFNVETGTLNYQVMVDANDGLLLEGWAKLNKDERILGERIRKLLRDFMKNNPPTFVNDKGELKLHPHNYEKFLELVNYYERKNKEFLDRHNLNAPDVGDDEGL